MKKTLSIQYPRRRALQVLGGLSSSAVLSAMVLGMDRVMADSPAEWPQKSIRLVVPNPAGGSADVLPRLMCEALALKLNQAVIVDNRPGAAGNIGAEWFNASEPDGYTLMASPPTTLAINASLYPKINYDPTKFVPITVLATVSNALLVHPSVPVQSLQEFIAYVRANPDKLAYASQGNGSTSHLTAELFKQKTATHLTHIPYKGDAPAIADLLAGHVQVMFGNLSAASAHLKSGKLKLLAVTSPKRNPNHPQTPAMNEVIPGLVSVTWFGIVAPPKTPMSIANKLSKAIGEILKTPEIIKKYEELGAEPVGNSPEELAQWMREETQRWREVIKTGGVSID
jgi:tripartite-type tricarboxylate transporter receptor subunit TctC